MKKVGILTSGGDAPGMNAAVRAITKALFNYGHEVYGIRYGYKGIIEKDIIKLDFSSISNIIDRGGTFLKSARLPEFANLEVQKQAVVNLKELGIEFLVVIGGDGSYKGAQALSNLGINCIALPGTIDNDMSYSDLTIGYLTACQTAMDAIDRVKDTMSSHSRLAVIEVMGRFCGDIAIRAAIGCGADIVITHETGLDLNKLCEEVLAIKQKGKSHCTVVITEGLIDVHDLAETIEIRTGWSSRGVILGHIQRGGSPVVEDRVLATVLGATAAELIHENKTAKAVGVRNNNVVVYDIEEALKIPKHQLTNYLEILKKIV